MSVALYHFPPSAPSRSALLVAKAVGVELDVKIIDLYKNEHLTPDFIKVNPQRTIPTLLDGDFLLWESNAIAAYLVRVYGKDDSLYPYNPRLRAFVDQRLYFNVGTLYPRIKAICSPILYEGEIEIPYELKTSLEEGLGLLDVFLEGNTFVVGENLTIADCSLVASVSSIAAVGWDLSPYQNVSTWLAKCAKTMPSYAEVNQMGADLFGKAVRSKLAPGQI